MCYILEFFYGSVLTPFLYTDKIPSVCVCPVKKLKEAPVTAIIFTRIKRLCSDQS